jgi:hypothetical protein
MVAPAVSSAPRWRLRPGPRRLLVLLHVVVSVGWVGADAAAYRTAGLLAGLLYAPFSLLALVTGVLLSLGTRWGLVRYYWVAAKLVGNLALVVGGNLVVVPRIESAAGLAAAGSVTAIGGTRLMAVSALSVGLTLLLVATALSVVKPWGRIAAARR